MTVKWSQIRNGFIYFEMTKTKTKREIPVNEDLEAVFKEIRKDQGLTSRSVFTYSRRIIQKVDRAFKAALNRAGVTDLNPCSKPLKSFKSHRSSVGRAPHS